MKKSVFILTAIIPLSVAAYENVTASSKVNIKNQSLMPVKSSGTDKDLKKQNIVSKMNKRETLQYSNFTTNTTANLLPKELILTTQAEILINNYLDNTTDNLIEIKRRNEWLGQDAFNQIEAQQQYPGRPDQYPGVPGKYPAGSQQYPEASAMYPSGAQQNLDTQQQYPSDPHQYPGVQQQYPDSPQQYPGMPQQHPEIPQQYQMGPQQFPKVPQFSETQQRFPETQQHIPIARQQFPTRPQQYTGPKNYPGQKQNYPSLQQNPQNSGIHQRPVPQNLSRDDAQIAALLEKYRGMVNKYRPKTQQGNQGQNYPGQQNRNPGVVPAKQKLREKGIPRQRPDAPSAEEDSDERRGREMEQQEQDENRQEVVEEDEIDKQIKGLSTTLAPVGPQHGPASTGAADAEKHRFTTLPPTTSRRKRRTTPKRVSLAEDCDYLAYYCLKAYDTGLICGRTAWYVHMTFQNYCMLDYVNCMERYDIWQIAHMGECFILNVLTEYKFYPYNDDYFLDSYYIVEDM